jgi:hypothetical protein
MDPVAVSLPVGDRARHSGLDHPHDYGRDHRGRFGAEDIPPSGGGSPGESWWRGSSQSRRLP